MWTQIDWLDRVVAAPCDDQRQFLCRGDNVCISLQLRCDGTRQCKLGEDEDHCPGMCRGVCVPHLAGENWRSRIVCPLTLALTYSVTDTESNFNASYYLCHSAVLEMLVGLVTSLGLAAIIGLCCLLLFSCIGVAVVISCVVRRSRRKKRVRRAQQQRLQAAAAKAGGGGEGGLKKTFTTATSSKHGQGHGHGYQRNNKATTNKTSASTSAQSNRSPTSLVSSWEMINENKHWQWENVTLTLILSVCRDKVLHAIATVS